jgi:hypothetical protein
MTARYFHASDRAIAVGEPDETKIDWAAELAKARQRFHAAVARLDADARARGWSL